MPAAGLLRAHAGESRLPGGAVDSGETVLNPPTPGRKPVPSGLPDRGGLQIRPPGVTAPQGR